MSEIAVGLATLATTGAALFVLLLYAPSLQAPFLVPKFAALELAASLGVFALSLRWATAGAPRYRRSIAAASLLVLATTAVAWAAAASRPVGAPYAVAAMARWGSVFGLACGVCVLDGADSGEGHIRLLAAVTAAATAVATIGLFQHADRLPFPIPVISTPGSTFGNRNAGAEVMAMALPLGFAALDRARERTARTALSAGLAIELVYLAVTRTRGAWLAAACGIGVALFLLRPRWSRTSQAIAGGVLLLAGAAATLPGHFNPRDEGDRKRYADVFAVLEDGFDAHSTALKTRFGLWRRTLTMIREHPLLGVGPGNWPVEFPRYAEPRATQDGVLSPRLVPRQAHNDLLERAAETGGFGLAAFVLLVLAAAEAIRARLRSSDPSPRAAAAAAAGALVALVVLGIASFPLEAPGTLVLTGLSLGLVATNGRGPPSGEGAVAAPVTKSHHASSEPNSKQWLVYVVAAAGATLLLCVAARSERSVKSSLWLGRAERAMHANHDAATTAVAVDALARSLDEAPDSYRAELRMAQLKLRQKEPADSARAARRALALEPYSPNAWAALAAAELANDDLPGAQRDASKALALLHDYPFALDVRARAAEQQGNSESALADRQHLAALACGTNDTAREARALESTR